MLLIVRKVVFRLAVMFLVYSFAFRIFLETFIVAILWCSYLGLYEHTMAIYVQLLSYGINPKEPTESSTEPQNLWHPPEADSGMQEAGTTFEPKGVQFIPRRGVPEKGSNSFPKDCNN